MKTGDISYDKNLKVKFGCGASGKDEKDCLKRIFCPVCNRYVHYDFIVAGICKNCFMND